MSEPVLVVKNYLALSGRDRVPNRVWEAMEAIEEIVNNRSCCGSIFEREGENAEVHQGSTHVSDHADASPYDC